MSGCVSGRRVSEWKRVWEGTHTIPTVARAGTCGDFYFKLRKNVKTTFSLILPHRHAQSSSSPIALKWRIFVIFDDFFQCVCGGARERNCRKKRGKLKGKDRSRRGSTKTLLTQPDGHIGGGAAMRTMVGYGYSTYTIQILKPLFQTLLSLKLTIPFDSAHLTFYEFPHIFLSPWCLAGGLWVSGFSCV